MLEIWLPVPQYVEKVMVCGKYLGIFEGNSVDILHLLT